MSDKPNAVILPDRNELEQIARDVVNFLRPKGYPIRMIREILTMAVERLEMEPLREPKPIYDVKK